MKKLLIVLLSMILLFSAMPSVFTEVETAQSGALYKYSISNGKNVIKNIKKEQGESLQSVKVSAKEQSYVDKLYAQMPKDKNYMFSPISLKTAFAMAANGADGNTKKEIMDAFSIKNLDEYNNYVKELMHSYKQADVLTLDISNALWLKKEKADFVPTDDYKKILEENYDAQINSSPERTLANDVNSWVKEKTNNKIDGIITDETAKDENFVMALLNAVYFKGAWEKEFFEGATKKDIFTDINGKEIQMDFMNATGYYNYYKDEKTEVLELPYKKFIYNSHTMETEDLGLDISMYAIRGDFSFENISKLINNEELASKRIALSFPKFKTEYSAPLGDIMKNIGVCDAFNPQKADFSKMFGRSDVYLMDAIQKTYINVDEKGTEAAAVTAMFAGGTSAPKDEPIPVKFNSPFTYIIYDKTNGELLFMGGLVEI